MNIRYSRSILAGVVQARVELDQTADLPALSPREASVVAMYGPEMIDVGGVLDPAIGSNVTLPQRNVRIPSDLPIIQSFSIADYPTNADSLAQAWLSSMETKVNAAVVAIRAKDDTSNSIKVVTHPV